MNGTKTLLLVGILYLFSSADALAKKRCKPLLAKLHQAQKMQRQSYSLKRGISLRAREDKARDKWWQCENSSKYSAKNKAKSKAKSKAKNGKSKSKKTSTKVSRKKTKKFNSKNKATAVPWVGSQSIVIESAFQGDKNMAWLRYYQQPVKCNRPKSLNIFAYCSEDKQRQQKLFEQKYNP